MTQAARGGAGPCPQPAGSHVRGGTHGGGDDAGFGNVGPGQSCDRAPTGQDDNLVTQSLEFARVRRVHDHRRAGTRYLTQDAIDFKARPDVDALCGLIGNDQAWLG